MPESQEEMPVFGDFWGLAEADKKIEKKAFKRAADLARRYGVTEGETVAKAIERLIDEC